VIRRLPAPLHRAALRLGDRARKAWWRWRRPQLIGCRVIAVDDAGRVLLIRHSYGARGWTLPAGGLRAGEDPVLGALRELREETACLLHKARLVETFEEHAFGTAHRVHVVAGYAASELRPDRREVIEAAFFALDTLPDTLPPGSRERLPALVAMLRD
jgi:ADP-ribose pyrophosphatase YjhB (NUDIX family)